MTRLVFWGLVALDLLAVLLLFVVGLAAAGSSRTSPVQVTLLLLLLPCIPLAAAVVLAARQLRRTPEQHGVLRVLLAAGADPNKGAQYEFPLAIAIQQSGKSGPEPGKLLLDAGANPNLKTSFGEPVWFAAVGQSSSLETLTLLLDRGADLNAMGPNESTALITAANTRNWKAALLLLQRGADWRRGRSVNGLPLKSMVDGYAGAESGDSAYMAVRRLLQ